MRIGAAAVLTAILSFHAASTSAAGPPMTEDERERLVQMLEESKAGVLLSVEGLSDAQWQYKPAEDRWSIAECAEHIAAAEDFILGLMGEFMGAHSPEDQLVEDARRDEMITAVITDRSQKFQASDPLQPTNRYGSPSKSLEDFTRSRARTIALVRETDDLRAYVGKHPAFGDLDALGWILFVSGHSERHTAQIEEVKTSPGYPQ